MNRIWPMGLGLRHRLASLGTWRRPGDTFAERAAERAYTRHSAPCGQSVRRIWRLTVGVMVGYMLATIWLLPVVMPGWLRLAASGLHALAPAWFADGRAPMEAITTDHIVATGVVLLLAAPAFAAGYAAAHREALARGFAAADGHLADVYLEHPGRPLGALAIVAVAVLLRFPALTWLAGLMASEAAAAWLVRLVAAPAGRARLAILLLVRCLRAISIPASLALAVLAATCLALPSPSPVQKAQQSRPDPRATAADAEAEAAYRGALRMTAAASDLARLHVLWQTGHRFEAGTDQAVAVDAEFRGRISEVVAFWNRVASRSFSAAQLRDECDSIGQPVSCRTTLTGPVEGSDGRLMYRLTAPDYGSLFPPGAGTPPLETKNNAADVFVAEGDDWRLLLHASLDAVAEPPRIVTSPGGQRLVIPAVAEGIGDATAVYTEDATGWQWLDTAPWLLQAAAAVPDHACLLHTLYAGSSRPMFTSVRANFRTMTASALFGAAPESADDAALGRIDLKLGIEDNALVVIQSSVTPLPGRPGIWARLFPARHRC